MAKLPLSTKLYGVVAVPLFLAALIGGLGLHAVRDTNAGLQAVYQHRVVPLEQLKKSPTPTPCRSSTRSTRPTRGR